MLRTPLFWRSSHGDLRNCDIIVRTHVNKYKMHVGPIQGHYFVSEKHNLAKGLQNHRETIVTLGQLVTLGQFMKKSIN